MSQGESNKTCDILIFGASGTNGREVAEFAAIHYGKSETNVRFGLAGHNMRKLLTVRDYLATIDSSCANWPILTADSRHQVQVDDIVRQVRVVCNVAGPFSKLATNIVDACVRFNVDYCDISGETAWMRMLIDRYHAVAGANGVYILPACGFVSTPADLATMLAEKAITQTAQREVDFVRAVLTDFTGKMTRGSLLTYKTMIEERETFKEMKKPYLLNPPTFVPEPVRRAEIDQTFLGYNTDLKVWTVPSLFSLTDTRIVRRSIALRDLKYTFNEASGTPNLFKAFWRYIVTLFYALIVMFTIPRRLFGRFLWSAPADRKKLEEGHFTLQVVARSKSAGNEPSRRAYVFVSSNMDPACEGTARLVLESAMCLAKHKHDIRMANKFNGGVLTSSTCLGMTLVERLKKVGFNFDVRLDEVPRSSTSSNSGSSGSAGSGPSPSSQQTNTPAPLAQT